MIYIILFKYEQKANAKAKASIFEKTNQFIDLNNGLFQNTNLKQIFCILAQSRERF